MKRMVTTIGWYYSMLIPILFSILVLILGLITPGYDHFRDTISILSVMKYGLVQQINFVLLGFSIVTAGFLVYDQMMSKYARTVWKSTILFCLAFIVIVILFPTDLFGNSPVIQMKLSSTGIIHLSALAVFFLLAPFGIYNLHKAIKREPKFAHLAKLTAITGYTNSLLCYLWTYWFIVGRFYPYLGLIQKIIGLITFTWLISLVYAARPSQIKEAT